jgi:predicted nucleic acid-binding protein
MDPPRFRVVVSNTGPLISALQSDCIPILYQFYDQIHIPGSELAEYDKHGAGQEVRLLVDADLVVVHQDFTASEVKAAKAIAEEIAGYHATRDKDPAHHLPESESIALMLRKDLGAIEFLIDELAARDAAKRRGVPIIGFPGILIRACQQGLMEPEDVLSALEDCQRQGTHYSPSLINKVYDKLKGPSK